MARREEREKEEEGTKFSVPPPSQTLPFPLLLVLNFSFVVSTLINLASFNLYNFAKLKRKGKRKNEKNVSYNYF